MVSKIDGNGNMEMTFRPPRDDRDYPNRCQSISGAGAERRGRPFEVLYQRWIGSCVRMSDELMSDELMS